MSKPGHQPISIPNHKAKDLSRDLLAKLLKRASISENDYLNAFRRRR